MSGDIYTGFWVDQGRSPISGSTLTLSINHANYLTSFLSFIVTTIVVNSLFKIVVFILYFSRPVNGTETVLTRQIYVSLLNSSSVSLPPLSILSSLLSRNDGRRQKITANLLLVPLWILIALKIGGSAIPPLIVSGSKSDLALAKPGICGFVSNDPRVDSRNAFASRQELYETMDARRYAAEQYSKEPARFDTQSSFVTEALPFQVIENTTCPFDESMCLLGVKSAITFDTGLLNSHVHLGINARAQDRVEYRWRSTCAVLNVTSRGRILNDTIYNDIPISEQEPLVEVDLGRVTLSSFSSARPNTTFLYRVNGLEPSNYEVKYVYQYDQSRH